VRSLLLVIAFACGGACGPGHEPHQPTPPVVGGGSAADDSDRDHDMIPDRCDQCPDEAENYNGRSDTDGCPDKEVFYVGSTFGPWGIPFKTGGVTPEGDPAPALDTIVSDDATAWDNGVEIQGCHTTDEPAALAEQRAAWVKEQLLHKNVSSSRVRIATGPCDTQLPHLRCALARPIVITPTTPGCPKPPR
jgi:hypothetical protein